MVRLAINFVILTCIIICSTNGKAVAQFSGTGSNSNVEYVESYTKDNGTHVEGYYRTESNSYNLDNFNADGNYNPYTGETGTKEYDSPYNSLYDGSSSFDNNIDTDIDYSNDIDMDFDYYDD